MSTNSKIPFVLLLLLIAFPQISETIYTPALPDIANSLSCSASDAEMTLSIYFAGFSAGILFWGWLSDRIGRRPSMLWALILYLAGCLACALSPTINLLLINRFIQAFGAAAGSVVVQTMLRDVYTGKDLARAFATAAMSVSLSPAIGPIIGGYVDQYFSWKANFIVLLLNGFGLLIASFFILPETRKEALPQKRTSYLQLMRRMAKDKNVIAYGLLVGLANSIIFSYYAEGPFISIDILGLTPSQYGLLGIVLGVSSMLGSLLSRQLVHRFSGFHVITSGACISTVGSLILACGAYYGILSQASQTAGLIVLNIAMSLVFIGIWLVIPSSLSSALRDYQNDLGRAGALFGSCYTLIFSLGTLIMSIIHTPSALPMPLYFIVISAAMSVIAYRQYATHRKTAAALDT